VSNTSTLKYPSPAVYVRAKRCICAAKSHPIVAKQRF